MAIHSTAIIDKSAQIDPSAEIGPYVIIEGPVQVGARTRVYAHAYLTGHTTIGADNQIHPNAVIGHHPQDRAFDPAKVSYCRIGNRNIIREGVSIHRATGEGNETVLGDDCYLMANSHMGHNCRVANRVTLANGALLAGHVHVADGATISGNVVVHQFCRVGEFVMMSGGSRVSMDVPPFMIAAERNAIAAVNVIGLRRNEFSREEIAEVKKAFKLLYRSRITFRDAIQELHGELTTRAGRRLVEFLQTPSKRGIIGPDSRLQEWVIE